MEELVYTSAPQGLQQGSSGFCTVEMTEGMPPEMMDSLEALSAYDNDPSKTVNWMHVQFKSVRGMRHVLSRVGPLKGEFSGRTNKLAHHICLAPTELPPQGPMRIVGLGGPLQQKWSGEVRHLSPQATPTNLRVASMPRPCRTWESAVGDAGAAGAVLSKLRSSGSSPLWVIRTPQMDALMMTDEMLALLSGPERWGLTFCTYLHTLPRSVECRLRWVLPDSPAMGQLQNMGSDQLIDLRSGPEAILRGADSQMVDAARNGKAVVAAGAGRAAPKPSETPSGTLRRRGVSQMDLNHLAPIDASTQALPPPPPTQQSSPLRWVILGVGLGSIPACLLLFIMMGSDPAPVVAMRELEAEQNKKPPVKVEPEPAPEVVIPVEPKVEVKPPPPVVKQEPRRDRKKKERPPVDQGPKIKSEIPINRPIALRLPTSALSMSLDKQTVHSAAGVYDVNLKNIPAVETKLEFELTEPDYAGVRDLIARAPNGEQRKLGAIYTEPDRVMFAWSPATNRDVAAAFMLTHEVLIKDETHHNTIQFQYVRPGTIPAPPALFAREFEVPIPGWVPPEFDVLVKPTFFSIAPDQQIAFDPFAVAAPTPEPKKFQRNLNVSSLMDPTFKTPIVRTAKITIWGDLVGSGGDRRIRFSSIVHLSGGGPSFDWPARVKAIRGQSEKYNEQFKNKQDKRPRMNAADRLQVIEEWGDRLSCQLELYVRINGRDVLCGKTAENTAEKTALNAGGESK